MAPRSLRSATPTGRAWRPLAVLAACVAAASLAPPLAGAAEPLHDAANRDLRRVSAGAPRPAVLRLQVLLDRAGLSPGAIDGRWGANTVKAIEAFQEREGLRSTGTADRDTARALERRVGGDAVGTHRLSDEDVSGRFVDEIPADPYEQAELECLCYTSLSEKLAETFQTTPALLAVLNPGVELDALQAGDRLRVPAVEREDPPEEIARVVVYKDGGYLRALGEDDRILLHAPVTVGASFSESPNGTFEVEAIARNPTWHMQPSILASMDDDLDDAYLPAGPNNPVGAVWIALSKPTYGIHGTDAPETIGYASSNGCIRLTNWDALFLADHVGEGLTVEFTD